MVDRIKSTVEIHASAKKCYDRWREFEKFPLFMNRVKAVTRKAENLWHWVITTPMGRDVAWDAVIDMDDRNRRISWHTVDTETSRLKAQSIVRFDEVAPNRTEVTCAIQFDMPGRPLAEAFAELLMHPQAMLEEEMRHFKNWVEGTDRPAAKATVGKTLAGETTSPAAERPSFEAGYAGPFDLDEVLTEEDVELDEIEDPAIRELIHEENPYLGTEGAWEDEDAWPREEEVKPFEFDPFEESLDVVEADDLENYTQDFDDNLDTSFEPGQSMEEYEMLQEAERTFPRSQAPKRVQFEL
jgi:hypothetical protein